MPPAQAAPANLGGRTRMIVENGTSYTLSVFLSGPMSQKIQITGTDSKKHSGTFLSFTDAAISYHDASGDQTIQKLNVSSVRNLENHHRLRNALIGAAIGGGAAGGITAGAEKNHDPIGRGVDSVEAALGGVVAGALVGAFLPTHSLVYDVNSH